MAQPDLNTLAEHYSGILKEIGSDVDSEGLKETPLRAAKALVEMTEGSRMARSCRHAKHESSFDGRPIRQSLTKV